MMDEWKEKINEFCKSHSGYIDHNNRLHLTCLCDSTQIFVVKMVEFLEMIGCVDIEVKGEKMNDSVCGYKYEASGLLINNG